MPLSRPLIAALALSLPALASAQTPIAWWRFNEGPAGVPASGAGVILDATGHAHDGTPQGGPVYQPGPASLCLRFDGVNDRISISDNAAFQVQSFTLEAYIFVEAYPTNPFGQAQIVFRGDDRPGLDPLSMGVYNDGRLFLAFDNAANQRTAVPSPTPVARGVWLHAAGTLNSATGEATLYINRVPVQTITTPERPVQALTGSLPGLGIGNVQSGNYAQYFNGRIDEVRIFDAALTPSQFLPPPCYANCDGNFAPPVLNVNDFVCFQSLFAAGDPAANCDASTKSPVLNVNDFVCFQAAFAAGCS